MGTHATARAGGGQPGISVQCRGLSLCKACYPWAWQMLCHATFKIIFTFNITCYHIPSGRNEWSYIDTWWPAFGARALISTGFSGDIFGFSLRDCWQRRGVCGMAPDSQPSTQRFPCLSTASMHDVSKLAIPPWPSPGDTLCMISLPISPKETPKAPWVGASRE